MKGRFSPKNYMKYKGDPTQVYFRSSWELTFMRWCDTTDNIIEWSSETTIVPYISPADNKKHRYFPDFVITFINVEGYVETQMIEIKPHKQTMPPKQQKNKRRLLQEVLTFEKNMAKWMAADSYCQDRGWKFRILTEKHLPTISS